MALPVKFREVLTLHLRHDLRVEEIASLLRIPAGTVKSRLHRARQNLATQLKGGDPHE
ncbi:sigma factor-like helix-turn-helix DNA-binding protein [Paenibacillus sabuli]|uniref:sigma factor-like helix-turn-helix DNA-binding protein n=1 Tax=Paenibacillus sabuli TaxID=2772509 RepID=UPI001CC2D77E|nr:sigma factor-like helix-turn-helix DNA-binding protein [Paenibacillus sabuli]